MATYLLTYLKYLTLKVGHGREVNLLQCRHLMSDTEFYKSRITHFSANANPIYKQMKYLTLKK